jgi:hypothetical protein
MRPSLLRRFYWAATIVGPIATAFAFMDIAAHSGSPNLSPMIGLEGGGAPNALPFLLITITFICISGALVARSMLTEAEERPSLPGAVLLSMLVFVVTAVASRPVFHAKWERDCEHGVGKACWAISQLTADPAHKAELMTKACEHGDPRGCGEPPSDTSAAPSASASAP